MGQLTRGVSYGALPVYVPGYVIGTKKEAPSTLIQLTGDLTFAGFAADYPFGTPGLIIVSQDAIGGHSIDWDGKLLFNGANTLNSAPFTRTLIDVVKLPGANWLGTVRGQYGGGTSTNGLPAGGSTGQLLRKNDGADYNASWYTFTKDDVGLDQADNTSDADKPISDLTQQALDLKAPLDSPEFTTHVLLPSSSGAGAGVTLGQGFPPMAPSDGDVWFTTDGFFGRVGATTIQFGGRSTVAIQDFQMAASDMETPLTATPIAAYARVSRPGTVTEVRASLLEGSTLGEVEIDIKVNGVSMLSTPLTIDQGETTSVTAAVAAVISNGVLIEDDEISVEIVDGGTDAIGLIVTLKFQQTVNPAAGLDTQVQFNDGGEFGASNTFTWNKTTNTLTVPNLNVTGGIAGVMTNPMTTAGDIVVGGTAGAPTRLGVGSNGMFMTVSSGTPAWTTITKTTVGLPLVDNTADATKSVLSATKWTTAREFTVTGAATGTAAGIDGTADFTMELELAASGVSPGIYQQVQVNEFGIVIDGTNPTTLEGYGITNALSNPMTVTGSLIAGGAIAGGFAQPTTLPPGTANQVLKIVDVAGDMIPTWSTVPEGFDNPMTAEGDLIVGGTAGAADRLAVGTDDQIMRVVAGAPTWVDHTDLSPTTTEGDLIVRGATVDERLAKGTLGQFLIAGSTTLAWGSSIPAIVVTSTANFTGATVTGLNKNTVGLNAVNNTADIAKDVNSALKWTTARTITLNGAVAGSVSMDGSSNVTITTTGYANPMTTAGDLVVGGVAGAANRLAIGSEGQALLSISGAAAWTTLTKAMVGLNLVDNTADSAKNVLSATKWTTARTITLTGDVTGTVGGVDGSGNISLATTLAVGDPLQNWVDKAADYVLAEADHAEILNLTGVTAQIVTVPLEATVSIPVGTRIHIYAEGVGPYTLVLEGGVSMFGPSGADTSPVAVPQFQFVTLRKKATNTWVRTI
jgi:hypothetical protein